MTTEKRISLIAYAYFSPRLYVLIDDILLNGEGV